LGRRNERAPSAGAMRLGLIPAVYVLPQN
jgi:hypothetical protein